MGQENRKEIVEVARFKIDPLRSENYFLWSRKMQLILRSKGVWKRIINEEHPPENDSEIDTILSGRCRDVALTTILSSIEDSCPGSVIEVADRTDVWMKLKELFQTGSRSIVDPIWYQY